MTKEYIESAQPAEKALLIAVDTGDDPRWSAEESLEELAALATTAGAEVVGSFAQKRQTVHPNYYLGKGKAEELKDWKSRTGFTLLISDDELSPKQQRALETITKVKVLDRSGLILDIFAQRARTHEGRLQVELAQLEYQLPRLTRLWEHLSRTGGGIGTRGPGETQLETDRRIIRERIRKMRERVEEVRLRRETAARSREKARIPTAAIVGYTNAGKSTLLNSLVGEAVVGAQDMLFATLDPTSRKVSLGEGQTLILTDTVGFIHKLPHQLVEAFRATLEEVTRADLLIEVVDASDPLAKEHRSTVRDVLDELGAGHKPKVVVYNKIDLVEAELDHPFRPPRDDSHVVAVAARQSRGLDRLREELAATLSEMWVEVEAAIPYTAGSLLSRVRERGSVQIDYRDQDVLVTGQVAPLLAGELEDAAARWRRALASGVSRAGDGS